MFNGAVSLNNSFGRGNVITHLLERLSNTGLAMGPGPGWVFMIIVLTTETADHVSRNLTNS